MSLVPNAYIYDILNKYIMELSTYYTIKIYIVFCKTMWYCTQNGGYIPNWTLVFIGFGNEWELFEVVNSPIFIISTFLVWYYNGAYDNWYIFPNSSGHIFF